MDDDDEVDILGEVQEDVLLPDASGFDGMGLNLAELLPELGPNSWLLSSNQSWNLDNDIEVRSNAQADFSSVKQEVSCESLHDESLECAKIQKHRKYWSNEEKEIFLEGFKLYGNKWSKISKLLGSRTTLQVKSFARQFLKQGSLSTKKLVLDDFSPSWQEQEIEKLDSETSPNLQQPSREEPEGETRSEKTEIVRLHRENSLSDNEDVDIEGLAEEKDVDQFARVQTISKNSERYQKHEDTGCGSPREKMEPDSLGVVEEEDAFEHTTNDFATFQFEKPTAEVKLERNSTTANEKLFHNEFFQGRPQKTPERYLKIRNYILDSWDKCKPHYLNKTSVRPGLKNCGDVNCIGRIHSYLEQIGAINFGCGIKSLACSYIPEQTIYQTILVDGSKKLPTSSTTKKSMSILNKQFERGESARQRKRKIPDLSNVSDNHGYTIEHGDNGEIVDVAATVKSQKRRKTFASNPFHLLPCFEFSLTKPAPYAVEVDVRAVFAMDVHAHMSSLEVIGLLGGRYDFNTSTLHVLTAEPCRSVSEGLECEMDPVSQTIASEKIQQEGYLIVGWYHSHPNFQPNPSVRDLDTQTKFQQWFSHGGTPFLGVIISPHLISPPFSKFRYLMVDIESDAPTVGYHQPFKFMPTFVWECKETSPVEDDFIGQIQPLRETSIDYKISLPSVKKVISGTHRHLVLAGADYKLRTELLTNIGKKLVDMVNQEERHDNLSELVSEECVENLI